MISIFCDEHNCQEWICGERCRATIENREFSGCLKLKNDLSKPSDLTNPCGDCTNVGNMYCKSCFSKNPRSELSYWAKRV
ncbi:MAG: hypothetical protein A4E56_00374 [Pelotomaculum sp. PtaU1.Bin065]|nr:MAG: hypothetical protein A4E56_00374 [Pelotomaculum sp. PtaU1.Bin065]